MECELSWDEYYAIVGTAVLKVKENEARKYEVNPASLPNFITGLCGELAFGKLFNVYPLSLGVDFNGSTADLILGDLSVDLKTVNGLFFPQLTDGDLYMSVGQGHLDSYKAESLTIDVYVNAVCRKRKVNLLGWNHAGNIMSLIQQKKFKKNDNNNYEVLPSALKPMSELSFSVKKPLGRRGQKQLLVSNGFDQ
jgi:hypothetical protein